MDMGMGEMNYMQTGSGWEQRYIFVFQNKTNEKDVQYKSKLSSHNYLYFGSHWQTAALDFVINFVTDPTEM